VAADMALTWQKRKTSQNEIWLAKAHVAHGPHKYFGLLLVGAIFHFFLPIYFFYNGSPYSFQHIPIQPI
jgi:hypothetical protein